MRQVVMAVVSALAFAGCATLGIPAPGEEQRAELAVLSAGDAGSIGCAIITIEGSPEDVQRAMLAASAAKTVLLEPEPNIEALRAALVEAMPEQYAALSAVFVSRLKARLDSAGVLEPDTLGWQMAAAFVDGCAA